METRRFWNRSIRAVAQRLGMFLEAAFVRLVVQWALKRPSRRSKRGRGVGMVGVDRAVAGRCLTGLRTGAWGPREVLIPPSYLHAQRGLHWNPC